MMRDYELELKNRIIFIQNIVKTAGADGIAFNNSGGKDCVLVGILCKMACDNTVGLILPCESKRNFNEDMEDAQKVAHQFGIETRVFDLTELKKMFVNLASEQVTLNNMATTNLAPRLRMITLYAVANSENRVAAGTGNRSEGYMGYFTKWGDGAYDFNPIADLTVTEVYEFLKYLGAPDSIISKAPSAGLFEGQTDEKEMGVTYKSIDEFLFTGTTNEHDKAIIERYHKSSEHKRNMPAVYK